MSAEFMCERLGALLGAYLDGELEEAERALIDEHLEGCAACRETISFFDLVETAAGEDEAVSSEAVGPEVWDGVRERILAECGRIMKRRSVSRRRRGAWAAVTAAAAAAVVMLAVSLPFSGGPTGELVHEPASVPLDEELARPVEVTTGFGYEAVIVCDLDWKVPLVVFMPKEQQD